MDHANEWIRVWKITEQSKEAIMIFEDYAADFARRIGYDRYGAKYEGRIRTLT